MDLYNHEHNMDIILIEIALVYEFISMFMNMLD